MGLGGEACLVELAVGFWLFDEWLDVVGLAGFGGSGGGGGGERGLTNLSVGDRIPIDLLLSFGTTVVFDDIH
mgnify:CR=1 FL=1